ncbi:MAG: hypothetical protein H7839_15405, partial [Magnetococcus sp. YQC-5]
MKTIKIGTVSQDARQEEKNSLDKNGTKTCWHCLVGETLKSLLEPVGIEVRWEVPVVLSQPKADIILIQRMTGGRT